MLLLEVLHVFYCHLDDLGLLDPASALLEVFRGDEAGQVGKTVVHSVSAPLFDYSM